MIDLQTKLHHHWSNPVRCFSNYHRDAAVAKKASITASHHSTGQNTVSATEENKDQELAFLKRNPLLSAVSRGGRVYGSVKDREEVEAEDVVDILKRSDMRDIIQQLLEREKPLDEKLIATLVSSLHDRDGALINQLYLRLLDERTSITKPDRCENSKDGPTFMTGLQYNMMLSSAAAFMRHEL